MRLAATARSLNEISIHARHPRHHQKSMPEAFPRPGVLSSQDARSPHCAGRHPAIELAARASSPHKEVCASGAGPRRSPSASTFQTSACRSIWMVSTSPMRTGLSPPSLVRSLILTCPPLASFAASDLDLTARAKNSHLSSRCFSPLKSYFFNWSRNAASLAKGESGSNFAGRSSLGLF